MVSLDNYLPINLYQVCPAVVAGIGNDAIKATGAFWQGTIEVLNGSVKEGFFNLGYGFAIGSRSMFQLACVASLIVIGWKWFNGTLNWDISQSREREEKTSEKIESTIFDPKHLESLLEKSKQGAAELETVLSKLESLAGQAEKLGTVAGQIEELQQSVCRALEAKTTGEEKAEYTHTSNSDLKYFENLLEKSEQGAARLEQILDKSAPLLEEVGKLGIVAKQVEELGVAVAPLGTSVGDVSRALGDLKGDCKKVREGLEGVDWKTTEVYKRIAKDLETAAEGLRTKSEEFDKLSQAHTSLLATVEEKDVQIARDREALRTFEEVKESLNKQTADGALKDNELRLVGQQLLKKEEDYGNLESLYKNSVEEGIKKEGEIGGLKKEKTTLEEQIQNLTNRNKTLVRVAQEKGEQLVQSNATFGEQKKAISAQSEKIQYLEPFEKDLKNIKAAIDDPGKDFPILKTAEARAILDYVKVEEQRQNKKAAEEKTGESSRGEELKIKMQRLKEKRAAMAERKTGSSREKSEGSASSSVTHSSEEEHADKG